MVEELSTWLLKRSSSDRAIVFCASQRECEKMEEAIKSSFSCSCYHGGVYRYARAIAEERCREGKSVAMCATSAFGIGVDYKDVNFAVHLGHSNSLMDCIQESGHCGRGGDLGVCVTLASGLYSARIIGVRPCDLDPKHEPEGGRSEKVGQNLLKVFGYIERPN